MTQSATVPAAAPYTSAEIAAVVQQLIQSNISYPIDTLGVRRTDATFGDFQQAAASVFILYQNTSFYILWLGTQRMQDAIIAEAAVCTSLISALHALGVPTIPVSDISPLFNAQVALQNLGTAALQRAGAFTSITNTPGFQQLQKNTQAFLSGPGQNVKQQGQIVQTPQQARAAIPGLVSQLKIAHTALIASVNLLVNGLTNYNGISLPSVVASSVLANAAKLVGADANALNALTPDARLAQIRQVVLNLIATNTVVTTFCSFSGPSDFLPITGMGMPYSDAQHDATSAVAVATIGGATAIIAGVSDDLEITLDGGAPFHITLTPSLGAELDGQSSGNQQVQPPPVSGFIIGNGTLPTPPVTIPVTPTFFNNKFRLKVGSTIYEATLTISGSYTSPRTADQIATDIQASMPATVTAQAYYSPLMYSGGINVVAGVNTTWTVPGGATDFIALGVTPTGFSVQVAAGPNAGIYPITAVTTASITITGSPAVSELDQVTIGPVSRKVKVFLNDPADVVLETPMSVLGDTAASSGACGTLGFFPGIVASGKRSTPDTVANYINGTSALVKASTANEYSHTNIPAHTNILNGLELIFAYAGVTGTQAFGGTTLTFTVTSVTAAGSASTGDTIALRGGPNPNAYYSITTINGVAATAHALVVGDVLVATGSVSGTPAGSVAAELGPAITAHKYDVVVISVGPNSGTYFVAGQGATPLDVELISTLPIFINGPSSVAVTASYGQIFLTLASLNKTTLSSVKVQGTGGALFFTAIPFTQLGTTPWFLLPSLPRNLQSGDLLYTYATQYNMPSAIYAILGVQTLSNMAIIELQPEIPDGVSWIFGAQPPPYAAIAYGTLNDYNVVQGEWMTWLMAGPQQANYFDNLNGVLNPVLVNASPRAVDIGNAVSFVNKLYGMLAAAQATAIGDNPALALDSISRSFTVEPVPPVDTLITTYMAKGADRAVDTLLSGDFATFFGLTSQGSSYGGALQQAVVAVAMNDLPIRKINRSSTQTSRVISQTSSPDLEYPANSTSEQLQQEQLVPPASLGSGQPSDYGTTIGSPATAAGQTSTVPKT